MQKSWDLAYILNQVRREEWDNQKGDPIDQILHSITKFDEQFKTQDSNLFKWWERKDDDFG